MKIYFPATCDVIVPGHIKCLELLHKKGEVVVGLLTDEALQGYKKNRLPFDDRFYVLNTIARAIGRVTIVPQNSLDPSGNILDYGCDAIASGDGWEPQELEAIERLKIEKIDISSGHKLHSSDIYKNEHI